MLTEIVLPSPRRIVSQCRIDGRLYSDLIMFPIVVEPVELEPLLSDDRLIIVDLCTEEVYSRYHLPGAIHVSPMELISGVKPAVGKLPPLDRLENLFTRIGYQPDKHIVAYDDEGGGWAGRFIWTLDVITHTRSSYLNGGLIAWAAARLPLTEIVPVVEPTVVNLTINTDVIAEKEDVLASIEDANTIIWDARSKEEYEGRKVAAARGGHVPGAINLDWLELMDRDANLRLHKNLREILLSHGIVKANNIITHCQTHHRSGLTYLVGKSLGMNIKAYHGSWSEWGNDPATPIDNPAKSS